jgi:hypothetical protein
LPNGETCGFLLGDSTGVGKGRQVAGIIYDNYLKGNNRSVWVSISSDLVLDAERDLKDVGARCVKIKPQTDFKPNETIKFDKGVIFTTYSLLVRPGRLDQL